MTVKELIQELSKRKQDMRVCVEGYEGGYEDVKSEYITELGLKLNVNTESYYGKHEQVYTDYKTADEMALIIGR